MTQLLMHLCVYTQDAILPPDSLAVTMLPDSGGGVRFGEAGAKRAQPCGHCFVASLAHAQLGWLGKMSGTMEEYNYQ